MPFYAVNVYLFEKLNDVCTSKGQTNSKWFFQADVSSKKRKNEFD